MRGLNELHPDTQELIRWLVELGYGFDFTGGPEFPEHLRRPLAEAWHTHEKETEASVEDYYAGLATELEWEA